MSFPKPTLPMFLRTSQLTAGAVMSLKLHDKGGNCKKRGSDLLSPVSNRAQYWKMCGAYAVISHTE